MTRTRGCANDARHLSLGRTIKGSIAAFRMKKVKPVRVLLVPKVRNKTGKNIVTSTTPNAGWNTPRKNEIGGAMQSGKIYVKGNRWYFRFQEPVIVGGQKVWRDKYINLAPRKAFTSAAAVEKEYRQTINDALGNADTMTSDTMTPVNNFIK